MNYLLEFEKYFCSLYTYLLIAQEIKNQIAALKPLQQNDNIIILPADKGRATVILYKEDYIRKCSEHLENGPYIKIKKDPTNSAVSKITSKLSEFSETTN